MQHVQTIAQKYRLRIIEDCAEAHGAMYYAFPNYVGSLDIGCFSFYKNKIIAGQEGGAIVTRDKEFAEKCRDMRSMSFGSEHNYYHARFGFNYRMADAQAEMILKSLENVDEELKRRQEIAKYLDEHVPEQHRMPERNVVWVYDLRHPWKNYLVGKIPGARHGFKPMSMQPMYYDPDYAKLNAYKQSLQVFYLPVTTMENAEKQAELLDTYL